MLLLPKVSTPPIIKYNISSKNESFHKNKISNFDLIGPDIIQITNYFSIFFSYPRSKFLRTITFWFENKLLFLQKLWTGQLIDFIKISLICWKERVQSGPWPENEQICLDWRHCSKALSCDFFPKLMNIFFLSKHFSFC